MSAAKIVILVINGLMNPINDSLPITVTPWNGQTDSISFLLLEIISILKILSMKLSPDWDDCTLIKAFSW